LDGFLMKLFGSKKLPLQLAWLTRIALFGQLSPVELRIVEGLLHQREYLGEEVVFDEGDEGQAIYIIQEGEVALLHQGAGEADRIATLGPDSYFGDMALLDNLPRTAQARATQPTRLAVFFREDFLGLMDTHSRIASKIAFQLAREMGRRLRQQVHTESQSWRQHQ
jgi:CRP/FNR family transcriptional regulator, cyclic AMP receptor protein